MKLVIDISEELKEVFVNRSFIGSDCFEMGEVLEKGIPLPKGHGRLIDADATLSTAWTNFYKHEDEWEKKDDDYLPIGRLYDQNGFECCQQTIVDAPTIIEAESEKV